MKKVAPTIFLSYARKDQSKVMQVYKKLEEAGFKPWMDIEGILPGEKWDCRIKKVLREADFMLICLSMNSVYKRGYFQREIKIGLDICQEKLEDDIFLIPVLLEDCRIPDNLQAYQVVELFKKDGFKRLVKVIEIEMERLGMRPK